jgi:methyltransferase (TIGR00027 family)
MIEGRPSETALHTAAARAAHRLLDPEPHILEDLRAAELLGSDGAALIETYHDDGPWVLLENRIFIPLRARYVEDRLREAYRSGARQYVMLGAGLDSFAFRQPAELGELTIFEVDHPSTQDWKTARIDSLGWRVPDNVRFVACDFETTSISRALLDTGFDPALRTLVSWMGVVYYLDKQIVATSLAELSTILADTSEVVMDYMRPWDELSSRYLELRETMTNYLEGMGEPHVNRYRQAEIVQVIRDAGFAHAMTMDRGELYDRYVEPLKTEIPLSERFGLAVATK